METLFTVTYEWYTTNIYYKRVCFRTFCFLNNPSRSSESPLLPLNCRMDPYSKLYSEMAASLYTCLNSVFFVSVFGKSQPKCHMTVCIILGLFVCLLFFYDCENESSGHQLKYFIFTGWIVFCVSFMTVQYISYQP